MRVRKRPVIVDAHQWHKNGDHPNDYDGQTNRAKKEKWEGKVVRYFRRPYVSGSKECEQCHAIMHDHGWIDTLEGGHIVCPGDFIITGVRGERYPCKPDIFRETYEAVRTRRESLKPARRVPRNKGDE